MASSGRYQSRLLNFVDRQFRHWRDRGAVAWRSVQTTLSWTAQILLYPLYVVVQASRQLQGRAMGATPQLPSPGPDFQEQDLHHPGRGNPPVVAPNPPVGIPNSVGVAPIFAPAIPLAQVRGIACDRQSRNLILIDRQNQPLALNPELQPRSLQRIVLGLSTWSYARQPQALPWVLQGLVRVSDRRQWQGIHQWLNGWLNGWVEWMATRDVAIAAHLFQESLDRPPAPLPSLPDRPWATTLDALDPQARPLVASGANLLDRPVYRLPASFRPSLQSLARGAMTPVDFFDRRWALWESRVQRSGALVLWGQGWQRVSDRVLPQLEPLQQWLDRRFFGHWIPPLPMGAVRTGYSSRSGIAAPATSATPATAATLATAATAATAATPATAATAATAATPATLATAATPWTAATAAAASAPAPASPHPAALFLSPGAQAWLDTFFDPVVEPVALPPSTRPTRPFPVPPPHPDLALWDWPRVELDPVELDHGENLTTPPYSRPEVLNLQVTPDFGAAGVAVDSAAGVASDLAARDGFSGDLRSSTPDYFSTTLAPSSPNSNPPTPPPQEPWHSWPLSATDGLNSAEPVGFQVPPSTVPNSLWPDPLPPDRASIAPDPTLPEAGNLDGQESWIETPAVPVGYEQHPLERLLNWLDRGLAWVETTIQRLLQRLLRGRPPY
ncbi:MAG: hypothetical protein VKK80_05890 [Prochlorothrix sp.]|nr:hypothetical protein [Prochlorothrix sp.]